MKRFLRKLRGGFEPDPVEPADPHEAAVAFWQRWNTELLPQVSAALGDKDPGRVENLVVEAVTAIHPNLQFAVERGQRAVYALVLSAQGDPDLRPYTDAWLAAAPDPGPMWEFYDAVPPVPDPNEVTVNLGPHRLPLSQVRLAALIDEEAGLVDVAVFHPGIAALDDAGKAAMTFLPLDATLGERLAGDRLGRVETAEAEPVDAITLVELRELVVELDRRHSGR
ncbi:hypothetical protein M8C13_34635 [Crossiella sp. SN42]|uniref:hypothetical protein n=1 Tax=unclassified Crossiella TaxID=2620835 RepID=UPI00207C4263|nr:MULTISPECIES: hypothetical protein [unclassified Crossiella]MCO1580905.1 hypothetical protein [Crossiella sp. SN42]WHT18176.1 hypothetical protein N8J89_34515 [Crossiella sp. CA-258035]